MSFVTGGNLRHSFVVIIPVADRPQHLTNVLTSLLAQCRSFDHGGAAGDRVRKVVALVADDSAGDDAIARHRAIVADFDRQGLPAIYFGATEQAQLLHAVPLEQRVKLRPIVGEPEENGFRHKGASVTRNLASLLARQLDASDEPSLFMFIDSDEQFKVRIAGRQADQSHDASVIDYFGCLDRIFSSGAIEVLTGKVVGDPPVSPAVMAGTFLGDIIGMLEQLAAVEPTANCRFHGGSATLADDAAYHDMADLFGFSPHPQDFEYRCPLVGTHDHAQCLADFSTKLDRFLDGEHPTRSSCYVAGADCSATQPARTVYTGNYVCTRAALQYFIPFAPLKLRMAGPVLGRLLRAKLGARFVSANLPLLHMRTIHGDAEFRAGVSRQTAAVDLTGEFERQYYGDVMLFTTERLIDLGYPDQTQGTEKIRQVLDDVERMLHARYEAMRATVMLRLEQAQRSFNITERWWNRAEMPLAPGENVHRFFANIQHNFDAATGARCLAAALAQREQRLTTMAAAIAGYADDRGAWQAALGTSP